MKSIATLFLILLSVNSWSQIIGHVDTELTIGYKEDLIQLNNGSFLISGMYSNTIDFLDPDKTNEASLEIMNNNMESIVFINPSLFNHLIPVHQRNNGRIVCAARDTIQNTYRFITYDENLENLVLNKKLSFDSLLVIEKVLYAGIKGNKIEVIARCIHNNTEQNLVLYYDVNTLSLERKKLYPNYYGSKSLFSGSINASANKIIRYDDSLNVLWSKELLNNYRFRDIVVNSLGEIFVGGHQGPNAVVVKLDKTGNWLAHKVITRLDPDADPDVKILDLYLTSDARIIDTGADFSYNDITTSIFSKKTFPIIVFYEPDLSVITSGHINKLATLKDIIYSNNKFFAIQEQAGNEWCCKSYFLEIETMQTTSVAQTLSSSYDRIFPNPTNGILNIPSGENYSIEVSNMQGQKILSIKGVNAIDLSSFEAGLYILTTFDGRQTNSQRVIKM